MNPTLTEEQKKNETQAQATRFGTSVSANDLVNTVQAPKLPEQPPQPTISPTLESGVRSTLLNVRRTAEGAQALADRQAEFADLGAVSSLDLQRQMQEKFGVTPERLRQLQEYESQLASMQEQSGITQTRIAGAGGQTMAQAGREITQEQRELAVRSAGTAAQAEILRGNIDLGRELANEAVALSLQDREFQANQLIRQIQSLEGQVDQETQAALADRQFQVEQELAAIAEVKQNVTNAIASGAATQAEVAQMTNPNVSDEQKLAMAQAISARAATEMRGLDIAQAEASIRASDASAAASWALAEERRIDTLLAQAEAGNPEAIAELGITKSDNTQPTADEIAYARQFAATGQIPSGMPKEISFGEIAEMAAELPKAPGTLVDINTGVTPAGLSATDKTAFDSLYNAINTDLPVLMQAWEEMNSVSNFGGTGIVGGLASTAFPSDANVRYETAKKDFLAKLLVARSGAAVTEQEYERYADLLPGVFNTPMGLGTDGTDKLNALNSQMTAAFDDKLSGRGLSVYGYSKVDLGGEQYTVGEIITNEYGAQGRVNPDGSITPIN